MNMNSYVAYQLEWDSWISFSVTLLDLVARKQRTYCLIRAISIEKIFFGLFSATAGNPSPHLVCCIMYKDMCSIYASFLPLVVFS